MREKLKIPYPVIVEGKYDKIKLSSVMEGQIITTDGFGVFKNGEKRQFLRKLSEKGKIIVLTDSDGAGKVIRSHISSLIPKDRLIELYIPQVKGKERRKTAPSAEGYLGVEGTDTDIVYSLLSPFASSDRAEESNITKLDFYELGLSGGEQSSVLRDKLSKHLSLPKGMTANALLQATKYLITKEELIAFMSSDDE